MRRILAFLVVACMAPTLAACTAHASTAPSTQHGSPTGSPTDSHPRGAVKLAITDGVRDQLIAAAAKIDGDVPVSQYAGLEPGETYYAFDPVTRTYWAGAALVPRDDSSAAAVSVQDDGSYNLFRRPLAGSWTAYDVGLAGVGGTVCPISVPLTVLRLWNWPTNSCHPPRP